MTPKDKEEAIRVLYEAGCGIRKIKRLLKVSRKVIRRVIKGEETVKEDRPGRYESIEPLVREHFNECKGNVVRLKEVLEEEHNETIPYSSLTRIVRKLDLRGTGKKRAGSYEFGPGREMQHDTSPHRLTVGGKQVTAQCASVTMADSKKLFYDRFASCDWACGPKSPGGEKLSLYRK